MTMKTDGPGDDPFAENDQTEQDSDGRSVDESETVFEKSPEAESPTRIEVFVEVMEELEDGERSNTVGFRDRLTATLVGALDEDDDLQEKLASDLGAALNREIDAEDLDRSELSRLLIRAGLQDVAPDVYDDLGEARGELAKQSL